MTVTVEPITVPTAELQCIGLADLLKTADLQTRTDRKYLLPSIDLALLLEETDPATLVLRIDERRAFGYESQYFDTTHLDCYHDAARKRPDRFKVRTRLYTDSGLCRLEVKTRDRRKRTVKQAKRTAAADRGRLTEAAKRFITDRVHHRGARALVPTLTTRYRRTTLVTDDGSARATIDTDLVWEAPDGRAAAAGGLVVVETKSSGRPTAFDRLLWHHGHRPLEISKYGTGMALLDPSLPANKWHPALTRIRATPTSPNQPLETDR
jgi:hypothetical protein